jgi:hypothetical protein
MFAMEEKWKDKKECGLSSSIEFEATKLLLLNESSTAMCDYVMHQALCLVCVIRGASRLLIAGYSWWPIPKDSLMVVDCVNSMSA